MQVNTIAKKQRGVSLVELVATIVLVGILAVSVIPRFTSRGGIVEFALRDQIAALYLQAQQRAMFDHSGACYSLKIDTGEARVEKDGAPLGAESRIAFNGDFAGLSVTSINLFLDPLGNVLTGGANCAAASNPGAAINISISGSSNANIIIHPTGYVARNL
ncbi:MAG: type II secretion system protein [Pseudomonadales bacterium]